MERRNALQGMATAATVAALILGIASPASAQTSSGHHDNFSERCDASVYISDTLIGSPGKIEAWGGFSCSQAYWGGVMRLQVFKNGAKVSDVTKNIDFTSTDHIDATVANSSGTQNWQANLLLSRPGSGVLVISTGVISS